MREIRILPWVLLTGCFADASLTEPDGSSGEGSSSGPDATTAVLSTSSGAESGSSSGGGPLTTSTDSSTSGAGSSSPDAGSSTGDDASSSSGETSATDESSSSSSTGPSCVAGTAGCACEGDSCDEGLTCALGLCIQAICGNGVVESLEDCDDGNDQAQDGCEADCSVSEGVAKVAAGDQHACALFHDGRLRCWGSNNNGKLGYGNLDSIGDDETPASAGDVPIGALVTDVACGREHTCVVLDGGAVRCWGLNNRGQLGIPAPVYALGDVIGDEPAELPSALTDVNLGGVAVAIAATSWSTLVRMDDGSVRCFGQNATFGTCGYGTAEFAIGDDEHPVIEGPAQLGGPTAAIDGHGDHACTILEDGTVRCWGFNESGALGIGNTDTVGDDEHPDTVAGLSFATPPLHVQTGLRHTCVLLDSGVVKCWGRNGFGQLGRGDTTQIELASAAADVDLGANAVDLAVGGDHACALLEDGGVRCWGDANFGRLGYGNASNDVGDDEVPGSLPVLELAVGVVHDLDVGNSFSCARVDDGEVLCWGMNNAGQIGQPGFDMVGDNETPAALSPIVLAD